MCSRRYGRLRAATTAGLRSPVWVVTRGAQRVTDADTLDVARMVLGVFVAWLAALELWRSRHTPDTTPLPVAQRSLALLLGGVCGHSRQIG